MSYTKQTWASGDVVTAEKLNHMENGIESAATAELPAVSATDNGDVLTVVEGAWSKAAPSGGGGGGTGGGGVFYVDATLATDGTAGTPSKTFAETLSAYEAGQNIMVRFDFAGMMICICWLMMYMTYEGTSAFGFIGYIDNHFAQVAFMSNDTITVSPLTQQNGN